MQMASLKLKSENRHKLYLGKYSYRVKLTISNVYIAGYHKQPFEDALIIATRHGKKISKKNKEDLKKVYDILTSPEFKKTFSARTEQNTLSLFSNNANFLRTCAIHLERPDATIYEANISEAGVIKFKRTPPANYRVFFKSGFVTTEERNELNNYIQTNKQHFKLPVATRKFFSRPAYSWAGGTWVGADRYIDADNEKMITMLLLTHGKFFGKRFRLEKAE
jgi:hypothetical protein